MVHNMITLISKKQLQQQRRLLQIFIITFILMVVIMLVGIVFEESYMLFFTLPICIVLPVQFFKDLKRIKSIRYDEKTVYYSSLKDEASLEVPLENIRSLSAGRFDFSFRINIMTPINDEKYICFKYPAIWPLGKKIGNIKLHAFRDSIDACKKSKDGDYAGETQILEMAQMN